MVVSAIKTHKITTADTDIFAVIDSYVTTLSERSVLVVTSKIVSICEGRVVPHDAATREELIDQEADWYIPANKNKYNVSISIMNGTLVSSAGIDESNGNGMYVLWPSDPQTWANKIRAYVREKFGLHEVGVIITDSHNIPQRFGQGGTSIAHSGFKLVKSYIGTEDLFGKEMRVSKVNVPDSLAAAAVFEMGDGKEQTPLAVVTDIPSVEFVNADPTPDELNWMHMSMEDDVFAELLTHASWYRGKKGIK